jgi:hypothetical protein
MKIGIYANAQPNALILELDYPLRLKRYHAPESELSYASLQYI